ncbi:ECF transporter S component [Fructilactobacillus fructivorans]|uniref:Riboflavin transporter n=1 Tax=Fructilactobacillus fructivorans TaxID=1614 RepID=A0AAE6P0I1_9LACO|nr:ECF transporter S component [Fructilactobacillus fructivorans]QFX92680.1 ECF transporter S component [Fructilactobacillus fructivorans]RDV65727.1 ECF transporter S component [Fructilactobacillus fructivorans]
MIAKDDRIKRITITAVIGAISFLLMLISFPIIPYMTYLKLDFSDIPLLICLLLLGPTAAIEATVLKLFIYWMVMGFSPIELVGLSSSFLASLTMILVFYFLRRYLFRSHIIDFLIVLVETVALTIIESLANLFITTPLYVKLTNLKLDFPLAKTILFGVVPFNLIKGIIIGLIFVIIAKQMQKWIKKRSSWK